MVPWELGRVSADFISREERSLVGRQGPGGECPFWSGISHQSQVLMKITFWYSLSHPSQEKLSSFSSMSYNHRDENPGFVEKLDLRNRKIQAGLFGGRRRFSLHKALAQQLCGSHMGSDPLAVEPGSWRDAMPADCHTPWLVPPPLS